jgi:hypothetical protein
MLTNKISLIVLASVGALALCLAFYKLWPSPSEETQFDNDKKEFELPIGSFNFEAFITPSDEVKGGSQKGYFYDIRLKRLNRFSLKMEYYRDFSCDSASSVKFIYEDSKSEVRPPLSLADYEELNDQYGPFDLGFGASEIKLIRIVETTCTIEFRMPE